MGSDQTILGLALKAVLRALLPSPQPIASAIMLASVASKLNLGRVASCASSRTHLARKSGRSVSKPNLMLRANIPRRSYALMRYDDPYVASDYGTYVFISTDATHLALIRISAFSLPVLRLTDFLLIFLGSAPQHTIPAILRDSLSDRGKTYSAAIRSEHELYAFVPPIICL